MTTTTRARLNHIGWDHDLAIETTDEPPPTPRGNQVVVEVEACGVCFRDCIDRDGRFKFIRIPITPGHEVVGRVAAVGPDVGDWQVGDRVGTMHRDFCGQCAACKSGEHSSCAMAAAVPGLVIDGGYASVMVLPERGLFRVPASIPAEHAAVMHCTYGTAWRGLVRRGALSEGQHVIITGANGGVGSAAIQVAKRLGATVTAVLRNADHADYVAGLGADKVVIDDGAGFHKKLGATAADVALDCVGPPTFNASLRSLRPGGRLVVIGNVVGDKAALNLGYIVTKGLQIFGSSGATRADMKQLFAMHEATPLDVQIDERAPLADADRAQRRVRSGGLRGRIVLVP